LHHFPRPYVALYEMLRVARLGVFLIEPNDCWSVEAHGSSSAAQQGALPRLRHNTPEWEPSGNYVYLLSRREIEKIALGLNLPQIVVKGLNDHYVKGCEFEPADESRSAIFREIVQNVSAKDDLCRRGLADYNMLMAGFIKRRMDAQTRERFCAAGWDVADLPANPYIPRKD